jgi:hypothetical protein
MGMLRIQETSRTRLRVAIAVAGNLLDEHLALLREVIVDARGQGLRVLLDLEEVELVGRGALEYLVQTVGPDLRIERCPAYLCRWIACERAGPAATGDAAAVKCHASTTAMSRQPARRRRKDTPVPRTRAARF